MRLVSTSSSKSWRESGSAYFAIVPPGLLIAVLFNLQLAGDDQRKDIDEAARALDQPIRVLNASSEHKTFTLPSGTLARPQARQAACLFQPIFQQSP